MTLEKKSTTENVGALLEKINGAPTIFAAFIPMLETRLGTEKLIEECEELRVKQLTILKTSCEKYQSLLGGYLNEITKILIRTLEDPFHDIRPGWPNQKSQETQYFSRYTVKDPNKLKITIMTVSTKNMAHLTKFKIIFVLLV